MAEAMPAVSALTAWGRLSVTTPSRPRRSNSTSAGRGVRGVLPRHQLPSGITKLAPVRMPEGQRVVTVLVLV